MDSNGSEINYGQLNSLLWGYRAWFDRLEFLLEVQLMVTSTGRPDWQHHMADLLEDVAQAVGMLDLERSVILGDVLSLSEAAAAAPEMWSEILAEQYGVLSATSARLGRLRSRNEQAIKAGTAGITQFIDRLTNRETSAAYDHDGRQAPESTSRRQAAVLFDGRV